MSEDLERAAKAAHQHMNGQRDWETEAATMKDFYRDCARAAIEEIREPTNAMLEAVTTAVCKVPGGRYLSVADTWRAMVDEMLK